MFTRHVCVAISVTLSILVFPSVGYPIQIGDRVGITMAGDGVRLRSAPSLSAGEIARWRAGQEGKVVDGPRSADGLTWWKIESALGIGWTAEAQGGAIYLKEMPGRGYYSVGVTHGGYLYRVRVYRDAEPEGLAVRDTPGGNPNPERKRQGEEGWTLADEPVRQDNKVWWRIRWDDGTIGWSADSQVPYGVYIIKVGSQPIKRNITVSPSSLDFGSVKVGESKDLTLTITNGSDSNDTLSGNISVSGTDFSVVSGGGSFSLSPGASRTVTVRFAPTASVSRSGYIRITHNATNRSSPTDVSLSGVGVQDVRYINLLRPWQSGQFWVPQSYEYHMGKGNSPDGLKYAADFYYANPQKAGIYSVNAGAGKGLPILAAHSGVCKVLYHKESNSFYLEIISKDGSFKTRYVHLDIKEGFDGKEVSAGEIVGHCDKKGWATSPHLHFEVLQKRDTTWVSLPLDTSGIVRLQGEVILDSSRKLMYGDSNHGNVYRWTSMPRRGYGGGGAPPPMLVLLSPEEGTLVSSRPTMRLFAVHPEERNLQFKISLLQNGATVATFDQTESVTGWDKREYESGETAAFKVLKDTYQPLPDGEYEWEALSYDGESWSEPSGRGRFRVSHLVPTEVKGVSFFALSLQPEDTADPIRGIDNLPIKVWDAQTQRYRDLNPPRDDTWEPAPPEVLSLGVGCWILSQQAVPVDLAGLPVTSDLFIPLKTGWNAIGNPHLGNVTWDSESVRVRRGTEVKTLSQARSAGWVEDYAWGWQQDSSDPFKGRYVLVYDRRNILPSAVGQLEPWKGYWIYAYQDCELILPPPGQTQSARSRQQPAERKGWSITVRARAGEATGEVMLGATSGSRSLAIGLPPDPPMTGESLRVIARKDGAPLAVDVRADSRSNKPWEIEVHVPAGEHDTATLWWQDVHRAPRGVNPVLVDLQTGERKFLRTASSHTFAVTRQGGVYKFRVELLPQGQLLRISQVRVTGGRSQGSHTVSFNVNAGAQVEVNVLSAGKVVRRLASTVTRSAGVQQVSWDGRDSNGVTLPAGAYLVEIKAVSTDGQVVRATTPIVLTR